MEENRLLQEIITWYPIGKKRKGIPKTIWMDGILGMLG